MRVFSGAPKPLEPPGTPSVDTSGGGTNAGSTGQGENKGAGSAATPVVRWEPPSGGGKEKGGTLKYIVERCERPVGGEKWSAWKQHSRVRPPPPQ